MSRIGRADLQIDGRSGTGRRDELGVNGEAVGVLSGSSLPVGQHRHDRGIEYSDSAVCSRNKQVVEVARLRWRQIFQYWQSYTAVLLDEVKNDRRIDRPALLSPRF